MKYNLWVQTWEPDTALSISKIYQFPIRWNIFLSIFVCLEDKMKFSNFILFNI